MLATHQIVITVTYCYVYMGLIDHCTGEKIDNVHTHWVGKDLSFLHADSKDSDQTGRNPRLI